MPDLESEPYFGDITPGLEEQIALANSDGEWVDLGAVPMPEIDDRDPDLSNLPEINDGPTPYEATPGPANQGWTAGAYQAPRLDEFGGEDAPEDRTGGLSFTAFGEAGAAAVGATAGGAFFGGGSSSSSSPSYEQPSDPPETLDEAPAYSSSGPPRDLAASAWEERAIAAAGDAGASAFGAAGGAGLPGGWSAPSAPSSPPEINGWRPGPASDYEEPSDPPEALAAGSSSGPPRDLAASAWEERAIAAAGDAGAAAAGATARAGAVAPWSPTYAAPLPDARSGSIPSWIRPLEQQQPRPAAGLPRDVAAQAAAQTSTRPSAPAPAWQQQASNAAGAAGAAAAGATARTSAAAPWSPTYQAPANPFAAPAQASTRPASSAPIIDPTVAAALETAIGTVGRFLGTPPASAPPAQPPQGAPLLTGRRLAIGAAVGVGLLGLAGAFRSSTPTRTRSTRSDDQ